jgi:hypothetical protein
MRLQGINIILKWVTWVLIYSLFDFQTGNSDHDGIAIGRERPTLMGKGQISTSIINTCVIGESVSGILIVNSRSISLMMVHSKPKQLAASRWPIYNQINFYSSTLLKLWILSIRGERQLISINHFLFILDQKVYWDAPVCPPVCSFVAENYVNRLKLAVMEIRYKDFK